MAKWLLIGDCHAVEEELDDMRALIGGIVGIINENKPDYVLFLGDQHHNHKMLNVEVLAFWREAFKRLAALGPDVLVLVGNHDMPGDASSKAHAMMAYHGIGIRVVDVLMSTDGCLLIPYRHSGQEFINDLASAPNKKIVFCHQTFEGSRFENGFYAKDGIDLSGFEDRTFISGHIHNPHRFANVIYIGAPRWRSLSDAGSERALFLLDITDGKLGSEVKTFDTSQWCQKLIHLVDREESPIEEIINPKWKYIVDISGSQSFIAERKARWAGCRIRTFRTDTTPKKGVSESMGVSKALSAFTDNYKPRYGTPVEVLKQMVGERILK